MQDERSNEPPMPPVIPGRLLMRHSELVGVILLAVLPLCALLGVFGPASERATATSGVLKLEVRYPARLRFHLDERIVIRVTNESQAALDTVTLNFSESYFHAFSALTFTPDLDRAHVIELEALSPAETRTVTVELTAERYGITHGTVVAETGDTRVAVPLSTIVFP